MSRCAAHLQPTLLAALARQGLLSYVVGGPWGSSALRALSVAANVPAKRTAELYRETKIVVNVFRDQHHYNGRRITARALNPRIYEALACGALVVSEPRGTVKSSGCLCASPFVVTAPSGAIRTIRWITTGG